MARPSAYYQAIYPDYMRRRISALRFHRMIGGILLHKLSEIHAGAETLSDRPDVGNPTIRRYLRAIGAASFMFNAFLIFLAMKIIAIVWLVNNAFVDKIGTGDGTSSDYRHGVSLRTMPT